MPPILTWPYRAAAVMLVALIGLTVVHFAHAQSSATLSCTPPTKNTDGTSISGPITYTFLHGMSAASLPDSSPAQTQCGYVWTGLAAGTHYFTVRATVNGATSANSNVAQVTITPPPPIPNPPTGLTVTVNVSVTVGP